MHIELQLHQEFVAERIDEIGRLGSAAHMADFDARARRIRQLDIDGLGIEARQLVFDRAQCFQHLPGQKLLGAPLRFGNRQHSLLRPTPAERGRRRRRSGGAAPHYSAGGCARDQANSSAKEAFANSDAARR